MREPPRGPRTAAGVQCRILLLHSITLSTGRIPLIYLGDEVGQLNDYGYALEPGHEADSRWVNRPRYSEHYRNRHDPTSPAGKVFAGLTKLLGVRAKTPEFSGNRLIGFDTHNRHVLGYQRPGGDGVVVALANFADTPQQVAPATLSGFAGDAVDLLTGRTVPIADGLAIPPQEFVWLRTRRVH